MNTKGTAAPDGERYAAIQKSSRRPVLSRRTLISALGLLGIPVTSLARDTSLAALGRSGGVTFGAAVQAPSLADNELMALLAQQVSTLTPELELKWAALAPTPEVLDYSAADNIAAFARSRGLQLRGHTLLWHQSMPNWFSIDTPWSVVSEHISEVINRYGSLVDEWDVVNEPIVAGGLRDSVLLRAFGPEYIARALHAAHDAAPQARLMINDYDLEYSISDQEDRRGSLVALCRSLLKDGAPLHGVGIQGHLTIGRGPLDQSVLGDFLQSLADLGLSISITELDVKERDYILPATERDLAVAEHVARFLEIALAQPAVRSLTCWGLSDRQSWLKVTEEDLARFPGAWRDGTSPGLNRGLPYDSSLRAKPMRQAIAAVLSGNP